MAEFIWIKKQFDRFLPRLGDKPAKRDETLAEIKAAYFIEQYAGYPIIAWEPLGQNGKQGDFSFCFEGPEVFCEVKSPGWEPAIVESQGVNSPRLKQPKYIPGVEGYWFDNSWDVRDAISKAYPKFPESSPTLLILVDDLKVPLSNDRFGVPRALYDSSSGCFSMKQHGNLGAIAVLNAENTGRIDYRFCVYHNPMAQGTATLPKEVFAKYNQFIGFNKPVSSGYLAELIK